MLRYNTQQKHLVLPEYGRNIQQMIDACLEIADREERTRAAYAVVDAMGRLFPEMKHDEALRRKLWDHLSIMSGFKLDIDWPYETVASSDAFNTAPRKMQYPMGHMRFRHYGKSVEKMVARAIAMPEGADKDELVYIIASQMKKLLSANSRDSATDNRIFRDLAEYSHGELRVDPDCVQLPEFNIVVPVTGKKKKKK